MLELLQEQHNKVRLSMENTRKQFTKSKPDTGVKILIHRQLINKIL